MKPFLSALALALVIGFTNPSAHASDEENVALVIADVLQTPGAYEALQAAFSDPSTGIEGIYTASNSEDLAEGHLDEFHHVIALYGKNPVAIEIWRSYLFVGPGDLRTTRNESKVLTEAEGKVAKRWMQYNGYPTTEPLAILGKNPAAVAALFKAIPNGEISPHFAASSEYDEATDDTLYKYNTPATFSKKETGFVELIVRVSEKTGTTFEIKESRMERRGPVVDPMPSL